MLKAMYWIGLIFSFVSLQQEGVSPGSRFIFSLNLATFSFLVGCQIWQKISDQWQLRTREWERIAAEARNAFKAIVDKQNQMFTQTISDTVADYLDGTEIENHTIQIDKEGQLNIKIGDEEEMVKVPIHEKGGDLLAAMEEAVLEWRTKKERQE